MTPPRRTNLYVYVDESGQDAASPFFIVVAIISTRDQERIRQQLITVEQQAKTGMRKWHKSRHDRRMYYLTTVLDRHICQGEVYFGRYPKPIPYFLPILDVLEQAIKGVAHGQYRAHVYIDGIDRKKARELTNALRVRGISLGTIRSRRDESEPLIRLADMWAGCIRAANLNNRDGIELLRRAHDNRYLREVAQ